MKRVELVKLEEINEINKIYENARNYMKKTNNPNQWGNSHPSISLLKDFINKGVLYEIINENGDILGVFAFIIGIDSTYINIEGKWKDESEYGTLHAVASSFKEKGFFKEVVNFAKSKINHIRIDTSFENLTMQKKIQEEGFTYQGTIHIENGDPRVAYEYSKNC